MLTPDTESSTLNEITTSSTEPLGPILNCWTQITLDDGLDENKARAQIQIQVQNLIRDIHLPWKTVESIPSWVERVVMDVLQQELDDERHPDVYRTACMKCLQALCKSRNIMPLSLYLGDVTREGGNPVAGGGFADIWKGCLHDTQVCLKVLRVFCPEEQKARVLRDFCQEALVWRQLRHPNILPFLGVNEDLFAPRYCLISPWMVNGNIMSYLEAHPDYDRLTSLVQVAEGMKYLHNLNPQVVHADIRGANILVTNDLCCCLADFGLSLLAESQTLNSSSRMGKGSIRWLAPEYIDPQAVIDRAYIAARDIYAYGCTVVEIFTGKPPFSDIKNEAAVIHMVMRGKFPPRPQHLLQGGLWSLVMACLTASPSQRPIAEQIPKVLASLVRMKEGNITIASRYYDNGATLQCASDLSLSQIPDSGYTSKSPLAGIANGGTAPSDPDHSNPITPDNQNESEFLDMDEDPPDEDEEEEDTDERDAYDAVEPGNLGPTPVQSTSPTSPHGQKIKARAAAEDFPLPPSNINSQKQAQAVARAHAAATVSSPQRPSGYDYPDPDQAQLQPPQQDQHEIPAFRALPLLSTDLPRTTINVSHSFVRPNDRGKEVLSFVVEVNPGSGKDGWKVKKMYSDVLNLDQRVRNSVGKGVGKKIADLPKGKLWKDRAPARVDQRKAVLQNYLQTLIKLPVKNNDEVIAFFTSGIMREMNQPVMQARHKKGYLTKRGKNFGGWKPRYFVLQGPVLEYYDCHGGAHLGSITVTGAQICRQQRTEQPTTMDEEKIYRHALIVIEAKKGQGGNHPRHVLCAESDADRDSWIEMLVRYFSGTYSEEAMPYSLSSSSSGPYTNGTSSVTLSEGTSMVQGA